MYDDIEPRNVTFLEQKEILDLTNCTIEIVPENLPTKRIWSKKYPIKIRTLVRKPFAESEDSKTKEIVPKSDTFKDPAEASEKSEKSVENENNEDEISTKDETLKDETSKASKKLDFDDDRKSGKILNISGETKVEFHKRKRSESPELIPMENLNHSESEEENVEVMFDAVEESSDDKQQIDGI